MSFHETVILDQIMGQNILDYNDIVSLLNIVESLVDHIWTFDDSRFNLINLEGTVIKSYSVDDIVIFLHNIEHYPDTVWVRNKNHYETMEESDIRELFDLDDIQPSIERRGDVIMYTFDHNPIIEFKLKGEVITKVNDGDFAFYGHAWQVMFGS